MTLADHKTHHALIAIIAMLVAMVGTSAVSRVVRLQVLRVLRPAEAAVRRLIFVAAQGLVLKPVAARPAPDFAELRFKRTAHLKPRAIFQLSDPMPMPVSAPDPAPRIRLILPDDPTVPAVIAAHLAARPKPARYKAADPRTEHLARRLQAISAALQDIPKQAARLARWRARRDRIAKLRFTYTSPIRPGLPPGYRKEPVHDVDRILIRCHHLARDARAAALPDTS